MSVAQAHRDFEAAPSLPAFARFLPDFPMSSRLFRWLAAAAAFACMTAIAEPVVVPEPTLAAQALGNELDLYWIAGKLLALAIPLLLAYFSPSWTPFQADRGRCFSGIVDGISV